MKKVYLFVAVTLCVATTAIAQPGFVDDVNDVAPIPGIAIAIAAAIGIGIVKLRRNK